MSGNIYISPPAPTPTILNQDINLNSVLQGQVSYNTDINVFLEDSLGNPITPTGSVLVGNDLTATLATPNPSGVALQFPIPSKIVSLNTYDTGWRTQNNWFDYVPPTYPAKYAELNKTLGITSFYELKTDLTVNGITNKQRFVDLSGVQGWAALNNLNAAFLDKLTGLLWTRTNFGATNYPTALTNANSYSVTINGTLFDDWYMPSMFEFVQCFGTISPNGAWSDGITGLTIMPFSANFHLADRLSSTYAISSSYAADGHQYSVFTNGSDQQSQIRIHKAYNLIS
jgi:hypothetical protein